MSDTTRLQLPLLAASQAQKHVTHNEAIMRLDGLVQMTAKSYTTSAQPGSPADGDLYLLPAGKTGSAWGGYTNHAVAHYYDGLWHQYHPSAGWLCFVQDTGILYYYTGSIWSVVNIASSTRPAFSARLLSTASNVTGDGTEYQIISDGELFDQGGNYNNSTGVFTAPAPGLYLFGGAALITAIGSGHTIGWIDLVASGKTVFGSGCNPYAAKRTDGYMGLVLPPTLVLMAANDTAVLRVSVSGSTKTVGLFGNTSPNTFFNGIMIG